jgi:hypothetical protein
VEVDTGTFMALCDRVLELEGAVADLNRARRFDEAYADEVEFRAEARGFARGRGAARAGAVARAVARGQRPAHLRVVGGGSR